MVLPGRRCGSLLLASAKAKRDPGGQPGWSRKHGTVNWPQTRVISGSSESDVAHGSAGVKLGALPWTVRSARLVSPSSANAALRIPSIRPAIRCALPTVKSHAR